MALKCRKNCTEKYPQVKELKGRLGMELDYYVLQFFKHQIITHRRLDV